MRSYFVEQLEKLNTTLIEMGAMIEYAIENATRSLVERDLELAKAVILFDRKTDEKEREIESLCLKLLLQQQPVARDLRLISAALKMITDMERISDQAADIAEIVIMLNGVSYIIPLIRMPDMAGETIWMVKKAIDAFVAHDLSLAKAVIAHDDIVDQLFLDIRGELVRMIAEDPKNGEQALDLMMIAKYLERIGDHAVNIAEWVEFSITGRHWSEEE